MALSRFLRLIKNSHDQPAPPDLAGDARSEPSAHETRQPFIPPAIMNEPVSIVESWVSEAEITGTTDSYLGKRRWPRFTWNVEVLLHIKTGPLMNQTMTARAKNVSMGGMGIQLRTILPAGTRVEILVEDRPFGVEASVVHCTRMLTGYLLGVCFIFPS